MQKIGTVQVNQDLCTGCERCVQVCPTQAITLSDGNAQVDFSRCVGCNQCVAACPAGAIREVPDSLHATAQRLRQISWQVRMLSSAVNRAAERTRRSR